MRSAEPTDAAAIHEVSVASCRAAYDPILADDTFLQVVTDPSRVETIEAYLRRRGAETTYLVGESADRLVGYVHTKYGSARPEHTPPGEAYLRSLYVHPDRWRDGVGTRLMTAVIEELPASVSAVRLSVLAVNERAKRFYERRGFERIDDGTYEIADATYPTEIYRKQL